MTLAIAGPTTESKTFGLTPATDSRCSKSDGATVCQFSLDLTIGSYTADVTTYDAAPVGGTIPPTAHVLSTAKNVPFHVAIGIANQVGLTVDGVPQSFVFAGVPSATAGSPFGTPQSFMVFAKDAGGFVIVGTYANPISLADSDASGATTVATLGGDSPAPGQLLSSSDVAVLSYSGLAIAPATLTASASGATNGTATFAPVLAPIIAPSSVKLFVAGGAGGSAAFSASETGWTNSPYDKSLTASPAPGCSSIATVTPSSGTAFTATLAVTAVPGSCTLTLHDGIGQSQAITLTLANGGNLFVADYSNGAVKVISPQGTIATIGSGFTLPSGVAVDGAGNVYVSDAGSGDVKQIAPNGAVTTVGTGFSTPYSLAVDSAGTVYVSDYGNNAVKKIQYGTVTTVATGLTNPFGIAVDAFGNVYVAVWSTGSIDKIAPNGTTTTVGSGFTGPEGVAVDAAGDVYVADTSNSAVKKVAPDGTVTTIGSGFKNPQNVAVDAAGDVYVADTGNSLVKEIAPDGTITTIGSGFAHPFDVALDSALDPFLRHRGAPKRVSSRRP